MSKLQWIKDYEAGTPQLQDFEYDALHRLTNAVATGGIGGNGNYAAETYVYNAAGDITNKANVGYTYVAQAGDCPGGAMNKTHAVVTAGSNSYCYDQSGSMIGRKLGTNAYTLAYDSENRLQAVSGAATATFVYDADGNRVNATFGSTSTVYAGNWYEKTGSVVKKYYYAGHQRVAMRDNGTLYFLLSDHLGSTSVTANISGAYATELRYYAYGGVRYNPGNQITTYRYTGQRWDSGTSLYYYGARWYDPAIGRFLAADTLVPGAGNPQSLNRYSYVLNNALKYVDPSGHANVCGATNTECDSSGIRPNNGGGRRGRGGGQPTGNSGVQAGQSNAGSFDQNDGGGTTAPFLSRLLLPDIYFRGVEAGGGVAYGVGGGVQEVWDFKHKQYALVIAESEMWTTPGAYAVGIIGVGNYGPNAGSIQDYQGRADELTLGAGIPIGVFPANISVTFGTSTNYITQPGSEITTVSFLLGGGTPGPGVSWAGTTYEILGEPTTYNSGWDMALGIVEHQISTGALLSPFGRMETPHLVLRALLK